METLDYNLNIGNSEEIKMEEKIAVVTGGSSGMGLAIAKKLQESGIEV